MRLPKRTAVVGQTAVIFNHSPFWHTAGFYKLSLSMIQELAKQKNKVVKVVEVKKLPDYSKDIKIEKIDE